MSKSRKFFIILISVILSVAAIFSAVTLLFQDMFIFKPGKRDDLTEKIAKSGRYERIKIGKYRGWLKRGSTNSTIVYFGGNNETVSSPCPYFRREFPVRSGMTGARLYIATSSLSPLTSAFILFTSASCGISSSLCIT